MNNIIQIIINIILSLFSRKETTSVPKKKDPLLKGIRDVEARGNYNAYYSNAGNNTNPKFTSMSIGEVLKWQDRFVQDGSPSSAVGAYQFIRATLRELIQKHGISKDELFDEAMQDRLAVALLERRGLSSFKEGVISTTEFANRLAREWASLPVMNKQNGQKRVVNRGQSYYAGDGLNKALVSPEEVTKWLKKA